MKTLWKVYNLVLSLAVIFLLISNFTLRKEVKTTELRAKKIVLQEEDGKPVLVMGNSKFCPPPIMEGKVLEGFKRQCRGMIFYNSDGDEVGGMIWDNRYFHFSVDRFKENQILFLNYNEDEKGNYRAGLHLWHSPKLDIRKLRKRVFEIVSELKRKNPEVFKAIKSEEDLVLYLAKNYPDLAVGERLFVGIENGNPVISFKDREGQERIRLEITPEGQPRLAFFYQGRWREVKLPKK